VVNAASNYVVLSKSVKTTFRVLVPLHYRYVVNAARNYVSLYLNEGGANAGRQDDKEPVDEEDAGDGRQNDEPEPQERIDLNSQYPGLA
jgi:hypothetical protein